MQKGSGNTTFDRRRTISVRRFAQSPFQRQIPATIPRKPGVAVCSKILGGDTHGSAPLCPGYLQPRVYFSSEALLPKNSCLFASGVVFPPHLPSGRRIRCLPHPQASRCSQPPENPQHWGQGSHHLDDHPLVPPAHSPSVVGSAFFASARCWWGSGTILSSVHSSAVLSLGAGGALPRRRRRCFRFGAPSATIIALHAQHLLHWSIVVRR